MPKIAVVIPKYGLVGGAEQFAAELTEQLCTRTGFSIQVLANLWTSESNAVSFQKIPLITFPKFLTTLSFAWFVGRRLQQTKFDLVHSHERIFAADIFTLHGIPHRYWIEHVRKKKSMTLYDRTTAWVERKLVMESGCKKFIAVSELTKQIFLSEYAISPDRVEVIHPGVHLPETAQTDPHSIRSAIRREWGAGENDLVVIFASMNFEIKGLDDMIRALALVKEPIKLIVAGKGDQKKYRKMAHEAGIADRVIFTGVVNRRKPDDFYLAGDLYMMLSQFDTFGMVVLEAMAAGLPVIVSQNVGAKDVVQDGVNGFVMDTPSSPDHIAAKIRLLFDETCRRNMSEAAYQTATQNTWEKVVTTYADLYREILDEKKAESIMNDQPLNHKPVRLVRQKILIIKLQYVGDTLGVLPVVSCLKDAAPELTIDVLIHKESAELIRHCPEIRKVWEYDRQQAKKDFLSTIAYSLTLIRQLRKERYDIVMALTQGDRPFFLSFATGAPLRVTYKIDSHTTLLMNAFASVRPGRRHFIELDADIVSYFGLDNPRIQPTIHIPDEIRTDVRNRLMSALNPGAIKVAIHPGARKVLRCWKPERFAQIARRLHEQYRASILLLGGPSEKELLDTIERQMGFPAAFKSCHLALIDMAAIFSDCQLFIGNDSGPGHIASAVGCPTLSLFGPSHPDTCRPYSEAGVVLFKELPCCGCRQEEHLCVRRENTCMDLIDVEEVWMQAREMILKISTSPQDAKNSAQPFNAAFQAKNGNICEQT